MNSTQQQTSGRPACSLCSNAAMQCRTVGLASCPLAYVAGHLRQLLIGLQAVNTLCYVAANAIILFGHCLWYAPSVLWLGFIRWEVRSGRV